MWDGEFCGSIDFRWQNGTPRAADLRDEPYRLCGHSLETGPRLRLRDGGTPPLQELAARSGAAMVLVGHLNKGTLNSNAMARVSGSVAFTIKSNPQHLLR